MAVPFVLSPFKACTSALREDPQRSARWRCRCRGAASTPTQTISLALIPRNLAGGMAPVDHNEFILTASARRHTSAQIRAGVFVGGNSTVVMRLTAERTVLYDPGRWCSAVALQVCMPFGTRA